MFGNNKQVVFAARILVEKQTMGACQAITNADPIFERL